MVEYGTNGTLHDAALSEMNSENKLMIIDMKIYPMRVLEYPNLCLHICAALFFFVLKGAAIFDYGIPLRCFHWFRKYMYEIILAFIINLHY